jgi:AcrR family transcriptional regulator
MPRIAGQIDETKTEAILDAALELFAERGVSTSMDAIARKAGVSRQTLYNRFPSKVDIGRALAERRSDAISAPLRSGSDPQAILTAMGTSLLQKICSPEGNGSMRGVALMSPTAPDLARAVYDAGPAQGLRRLTDWLAEQDRLGTLSVPEPALAAEMFVGMVLGHGHLRSVLGVPHPAFDPETRAAETARRFIRAFAP